MYNVIVTDLAQNTLRHIVMYITDNLKNKKAANDFLDEVTLTYKNLASTPDARLKKLGYRRVVIKNYILVYRIAEENEDVYILRFFYGGSNYENILI